MFLFFLSHAHKLVAVLSGLLVILLMVLEKIKMMDQNL